MDYDALYRSVIRQESGGDPNARSYKGALGMMQVMPKTAMDPGYGVPNIFETARELGFDVQSQTPEVAQMLLRQPEINMAFGKRYLNAMIDRYKSPDKALAAYNWGPGAVGEWSGQFEDLPAETQDYIQKIRRYYAEETGEGFPTVLAPPPRPGGNGRDERLDAATRLMEMIQNPQKRGIEQVLASQRQ